MSNQSRCGGDLAKKSALYDAGGETKDRQLLRHTNRSKEMDGTIFQAVERPTFELTHVEDLKGDALILALDAEFDRIRTQVKAYDRHFRKWMRRLPRRIWQLPVTITTPSGKMGKCESPSDVRKLFSDELELHPKSGMENWSDELKAAHERIGVIRGRGTLTAQQARALDEYWPLRNAHDLAISRDIHKAEKAALEKLDAAKQADEETRDCIGWNRRFETSDRLGDRLAEIEDRIIETPAKTMQGIVIKLRHALSYVSTGSFDESAVRSAYDDARRLGGYTSTE